MIIRLSLLLLLFSFSEFICTQNVKAESPDSKKNLLRGYTMNGPALLYMHGDSNNVFQLEDAAIEIAENAKDSLQLIKSYINKALALRSLDKVNASSALLLQILPVLERTRSKDLNILYNELGINHAIVGNYAKALEFHLKALMLSEVQADTPRIDISYFNIGLVHYKLSNSEKTLEYFTKSLELKSESHDQADMDLLLIYMGLNYCKLQKFPDALASIERGLELCGSNCPDATRIIGDFGLGVTYYNVESIEKARFHLTQSHDLAIKINDNRYVAENLLYLSRIFLDKKDYKGARSALKKAEEIAVRFNYSELLLDTYRQFSELYIVLKDYTNATHYQAKFVAQRDTVYGVELVHKISALQVEFEERHHVKTIAEQKELMDLQQQTLRQERLVNIVIGLIVIMLLVIMILLYRSYRNKKNMNQKLDLLVQEKTMNIEKQYESLYEANIKLQSSIKDIASQFNAPLATLRGICYLGKMETEDKEVVKELNKLEETVDEIATALAPLKQEDSSAIK